MPIKINGATSGSTTIAAPDTGSDETIVLSTALASKLPYSFGTATPSTSVDGFLWYDENDTPPTPKFWDGAAFQALTSGKILQIVRATDTTNRTTTSTSYVDVTGMSVTISPQKSDSAIILIATFNGEIGGNDSLRTQITDSSNNAISGAQNGTMYVGSGGGQIPTVLIAYATPATTSATTYKLRFRTGGVSGSIRNSTDATGQMYAIEVSA